MKPVVLFIYIDYAAKVGILPYLSTIFHPHLDFESQQINALNLEHPERFSLILFSSAMCQRQCYDKVAAFGIPTYTCRRALNHTYIHRILDIPLRSQVCLISDRKGNCESLERELIALGFNRFQYTYFYPGAPEISPSIQYGITPGESRFAPPTLRQVSDIGNRVADIGTVGKLITFFHIPEVILNQVTEQYTGYISNFIRYINWQMSQPAKLSLLHARVLDAMDLGLLLTDREGKILYENSAGRRFLCLNTTSAAGRKLTPPPLCGILICLLTFISCFPKKASESEI